MNAADWFDVLTEVGGRRLRRAIGITLVAGLLIVPQRTTQFLEKVAAQRAQEVCSETVGTITAMDGPPSNVTGTPVPQSSSIAKC